MKEKYILYTNLFTKNIEGLKSGLNGQSKGLCPFHEDSNPSFAVNLDSGLWKCFAGCGSGNALQFAQKLGIDPTPYKNEDSEYFPKNTGFLPSIKRNPRKNGNRAVQRDSELTPEDKKRAFEYNKYLIDNFHLCQDSWSLETVEKTFTGYDPDSETFTFIHTNSEGKAVNIKWHKTGGKPRSVTGHGSCRLYPLHLISEYPKDEPLIYCEGEKDCLTLVSRGFNAVTGTTGADSIPDLSPIKDFREIVVVFDNDEAGRNGSDKLAKTLKENFPITIVKVLNLEGKKGFDVTDFFNDGKTGFQKLFSEAKEIGGNRPEFNLTDAGNAEFLIHLYGNQLRFNHTEGSWYIWNGHFWKKDEVGGMLEFVINMARQRQTLAVNINDSREADQVFRFGKQSESKVKIGFCLDLAKSFFPVSTISKHWNVKPYLLQFNNGVMNLETNSFDNGSPEFMISKTVGFDYSPSADCPRWKQFVSEIMDNNSNLIEFLQKAVGYSLSGDITEQCFFLLYGSGANGKSVILEILRLLLGDYATDSPFSAFEYRYRQSQTNDLARLNSARLVTSAESGSSKRLDEERIKAITGGDTITARFLFREFFTFSPKFKLWLSVNSLPKVEDFSHGFWRRVRLIPFNVRFEGEKADRMIVNKLKSELSGIMNWAIKGFDQWKKEGLNPPLEVIDATKDYQNEADVVSEFLDSMVSMNHDSLIKASKLYLAFKEWYEKEYSGKPITQTTFGRRVSISTGIKSDKIGGYKHYQGLELKENDEVPF